MTETRSISLYNTAHKSVEKLVPLLPGSVRLYCCGPTVYNFQHIGNLRTYIFEDILVRTLKACGYQVEHVMNITDVGHLVSDGDTGEDKMLVATKREKKTSREIADYYTQVFLDDCQKLHINRPSVICKATEHISEMIALIQRLEKQGYTYISNGNVYFDISKNADYGKLAGLKLEQLTAGARIEIDSNKKNPHDFVLWFTKSKFEGQEMQWDSPWGRGYPGWHIECSAMSIKYLGEEFDIHCGGVDHIPVHHTNEIAQSECATGKPWVRVWMHGEFLVNENKEKMAKSKDGFLTLQVLEDKGFTPLDYRFFCLTAHYRQQLRFSWEALTGASQALDKLKRLVLQYKSQANIAPAEILKSIQSEKIKPFRTQLMNAFCNDLNAPLALAAMWSALADKDLSAAEKLAFLYDSDQILGLGMQDWVEVKSEIPAEVMDLAYQRDAARKSKDFKRADELRAELKNRGYTVEDSAQGPVVKVI